MELKNVIIEVKKHIDFIEEILNNLEENPKRQNEQEIDFQKIEQFAKQSAFKFHFLKVYNEDVVVKYCTLLASYVRFADSVEKKIKQYYFLSRILYNINYSKELEEIITSAELVNIKDFEIIKQELKNDIKLFLFDILLMISFDGKIDEKQLSYFCETLAYVDMDKKDFECLYKVCSCVLSGKKDELYKYALNFPIMKVSCYLQSQVKNKVITPLDWIKKEKEMDVSVIDMNVKNIELDLDTYGKRSLKFLNCRFENVSSIRGIKTKIVFENCYFGDCRKEYELPDYFHVLKSEFANKESTEYEYGLFSFVNADFINCSFERCSHINHYGATILLKMDSGKIENCNFISCSVGSTSRIVKKNSYFHYRDEYGALIYVDKVCVTKTKYQNCIVKGNGCKTGKSSSSGGSKSFAPRYQYLNLIYCKGGNIEKCEFLSCKCSGLSKSYTKRYNYLINSVEAIEKDNQFTKCTDKIGTAEWSI